MKHEIRPKKKHVIKMSPYLPYDKEQDGKEGIQLRIYGREVHFVDVVWGETTELEIIFDD